jgi:threonine 3-dehydrogenase
VKALVKANEAPGFEYIDTDVPKIGPRDVLIKVKGTTICGSDIHAYHSSPGIMHMMKLPVILGHETCGEVVEVGECVTRLKKGDLVSPEPHIFCGNCYYCQTGAALNCQNLGLFGLSADGAFAEYARVPEIVCWKHPEGTPYELGAIHEPLGVAMHGVMAGEVNGKSVAVFGCGPIGLFAIGEAKVFGATKVFGLEVAPKRLEMARKLFPDVILINPKEQDPVQVIMEATDGLGVDVSIELSGSPEAMKQTFKVLRREGRVSLVGVPPGPVELEVHKDIILKEARVFGVFGRAVWQTWWQVRAMLDTGKFDPLPVITHRFPLSEFKEAFELATSGQAGKILLYPE